MPLIGPISRQDFIKTMRKLAFTGPSSGGKHEFMARGNLRVRIPNPHHGDIGTDLLNRILKQAGIDRKDWESI